MQLSWRAKDSNRVGQQAEHAALNFLKQQGLTFIARNYRCRLGEIDLIMQDQKSLVFIEVRYRKSTKFGSSAESVSNNKQQKIIRCAAHYLLHASKNESPACRFDVIAIYPSGTGKSSLQFDWIKNAFQA